MTKNKCSVVNDDEVNQEVMPEERDWHTWCRLCANDDTGNIKVYSQNDQQSWNSVLATAIGKYFWVNIKIEDELSNLLCKECYTLINKLMAFTEHVNKVQAMFNVLHSTRNSKLIDLQAVRSEYGLLSNEWEHIIKLSLPQSANEDDKCFTVFKEENIYVEVSETVDNEEEELLAEIEEEVAQELLDNQSEYDEHNPTEDTDAEVIEQTDDDPSEENIDKTYEEIDETIKEYTPEEFLESDFILEEEEENITVSKRRRSEENEVKSISSYHSRSPSYKQLISDEEDYNEDEDLENDEFKHAKVTYLHSKYNCSKCYKSYKKPMAYKKHMLDEHKVEPNDLPDLQCKRCDRTFSTENQLLLHFRTHMSSKEKAANPCPICRKKFTTIAQMRRHVEGIHQSQRPYMCDTCGKSVKTLSALKEHKLVHTDECPFECEVCHRRFKNKARLKIHSDIHTNNGYVCNICGLKLNTKRTLNMHMLVHTEEKQFKCDICDASFKRSKTLKAHLILHTGLRPYVCNFCGKTFSNGSNCRMHKRKAHPEELAAEELEGKRTRTKTPHLKELVAATREITPARKIVRSSAGLTEKMRSLLMAAEEREKRQATFTEAQEADGNDIKVETCIEVMSGGTFEEMESAIAEDHEIVYEIVEEI